MEFPANLKYTKDHEWLKIDGTKATIGVSAYAIEHLGDIVHVELPEADDEIESGEAFGTIESTKTVSDMLIPEDCKVLAINEDVADAPESLQDDMYDKGWLVKVEFASELDQSALMDSEAYKKYISELDD